MERRIAGASFRLLRRGSILVIVHPLFTIASANCFTTPWLMLRVCLRVCSGKGNDSFFFLLFFSSLFPLNPGHVNNASSLLPRGWPQSGFRNIFRRSFLLLSRTDAEVLYPLSLSVSLSLCPYP